MKGEDRQLCWGVCRNGMERNQVVEEGKQGPERVFIYFFSFDIEAER